MKHNVHPVQLNKLCRIIAIILCLSMLTGMLAGCGVFDAAGDKIADSIVDKYAPENEYNTSLNDPTPVFNPNGPNGAILYETVLLEDILEENILHEDVLEEQIFKEIVFSENILFEDVIVESVLVEVIEDVDDLNEFICESYHSEMLDYSLIKQRLAAGISLVLAEVVIDTGSAIINIVTCNWGGLAMDAGQIVLTAGGTTLMAFIEGQVAKAKSLAAGNSYEVAMYDCLDAASTAYYYTAVTLDVVNTIISTVQLAKGLYDVGKTIYKKLTSAEKIYDAAGNVIGKLKDGGKIEVEVNGKKLTCQMIPGDRHLYDVATQAYVGTLDDSLKLTVREIPSEIYKNGTLKYTVRDGNIFTVTRTGSGEIIETVKGTIDGGGFVKNGFGQIVEKIDFDTGKTIGNFKALTESLQNAGAPNVTVNVFGELVDLNTGKAIQRKVIDGVTTYVDDAGKALLTEYVGTDGVTYIKRLSDVDNGKTVGALTDGVLDGTWKDVLNQRRSDATQAVRKAIAKFVEDKPDRIVRKYFPQLTAEQIDYIRSYGKLPTDFEIHHVKNVANYPDLADDFSNLEMLSHEAHQAAHNGKYQTSTVAPTETYVDLIQVLAGYFG